MLSVCSWRGPTWGILLEDAHCMIRTRLQNEGSQPRAKQRYPHPQANVGCVRMHDMLNDQHWVWGKGGTFVLHGVDVRFRLCSSLNTTCQTKLLEFWTDQKKRVADILKTEGSGILQQWEETGCRHSNECRCSRKVVSKTGQEQKAWKKQSKPWKIK